ncbi:MAG: chromosomal replication initiator protein DnaA, partial [Methylophilaceae bacterium]|nr:chromosomal replication initiator protein DnaA [Methylophilaceae bacterium]
METVWSACLDRLEQELPSSQFNTWIMPLNAEINGDTLRLSVSDRFAMQWIKERWFTKIESLCKEHSTLTRVELVLVETASTNKQEQDLPKQKLAPPSVKKSAVVASSDPSYLNPNLSFENYVLGNANQMAAAMAIQVAKSLGKVWNPLFIYGGVGLGKTHMLQAIGNAAKNCAPNTKIRYLHAETYVSDVVKTYSGSKTFDQISNQFRQKYHSLDLLLIDDIQFFANKSRTQEEFFYAFNALIEAGKQIVITCDAHPKEVENIEARLKTRFDWGLTVAIQPPELEMRVAILLKKAAQSGLSLPQNVAFFIATQVHSSVREL